MQSSSLFLKKKILEKEVEINDKFESAGEEELEGVKIVALYFAAYPCPACRIFTNCLKDFYNDINLDQKFLEIIYVPCDPDEDSHKSNYALMPWLSFRYGDEYAQQLRSKFEVKQIPYLVVLDPLNQKSESTSLFKKYVMNNKNVISIRGRKQVQDQPNECFDLWLKCSQTKKYMDPIPDTPISVTVTEEAQKAIKVYDEWKAEREKEKQEEKEKEEREQKYGVS